MGIGGKKNKRHDKIDKAGSGILMKKSDGNEAMLGDGSLAPATRAADMLQAPQSRKYRDLAVTQG
jgi:hypothetical protein